MAIDAFRKEAGAPLSPALSEYIKKGCAIGAYTDKTGWYHDGLVRLASFYGAKAFREAHVRPARVKELLDKGYLVIFSLKVAFINTKTFKERLTFWKKRGGHLALAISSGSQNDTPGFIVHHTSIREHFNWPHRFVPLQMFKAGFCGNIIVIGPRCMNLR